jgi:hypothetical protein
MISGEREASLSVARCELNETELNEIESNETHLYACMQRWTTPPLLITSFGT